MYQHRSRKPAISRDVLTAVMLVLVSAVSSFAQNVSWYSTTQSSPWVDKGPVATSTWDNDITLYIEANSATKYQTIEDWGGGCNELGWDALSALSPAVRESVLKAIFDSTGCGINNIRIPIGANDYSMGWYSCNDTKNDFQMNNFTLARDNQRLIPYVKAALEVRPDLKVWGSPWSPPGWMKTNDTMIGQIGQTKGSLIMTSQNLTAYALYFDKWVRGMRAEGIPIYAVHVQNEPNITNNYPSCLMVGEQFRVFIADYLGPRFQSSALNCEIWLGTIQDNDFDGKIKTVLNDSKANAFITGVGLQWWGAEELPGKIRAGYPTKKILQTELQCGNFFWSGGYDPLKAPNDWNYGVFTFDQMSKWIKGGVNGFCQWNIVLDSAGKSWDDATNWHQNSMISITKGAKIVHYNPQFYVVKHFGRFVKPGARRISSSGNFNNTSVLNLGPQYTNYRIPTSDNLAFQNSDGSIVIVARNSNASVKTVAIKVGNTKFKPTLPSNSINTFVVRPISSVRQAPPQKQLISLRVSQGGIAVSLPKVQTAQRLRIEIVDARGRTVAVPCNRMSDGGDCFVRFYRPVGSGVHFARLQFNGVVSIARVAY